jgi:hypothetical protein
VTQNTTELSPEEVDFGFAPTETPTGVRALIAQLPDGLKAVKRQAPEGAVQYDVCDASLQPLYAPARTVDELTRRFRRSTP